MTLSYSCEMNAKKSMVFKVGEMNGRVVVPSCNGECAMHAWGDFSKFGLFYLLSKESLVVLFGLMEVAWMHGFIVNREDLILVVVVVVVVVVIGVGYSA